MSTDRLRPGAGRLSAPARYDWGSPRAAPPRGQEGSTTTTVDQLQALFEYGFFPDTRTIYLLSISSDVEGNESGIDIALVAYVLRALDYLEACDSSAEVRFVLNSPGGSWDAALAIYDRIMGSPCSTRIEVYGAAHSGAPVILQAADRRCMAPHATLMIHDGSIAGGMEESTRDVEAWGRFSSRVERPRMYEILSRRSRYSAKRWKVFCKQDFYLTAKKALGYRLIDEILDAKSAVDPSRQRFIESTPKRS